MDTAQVTEHAEIVQAVALVAGADHHDFSVCLHRHTAAGVILAAKVDNDLASACIAEGGVEAAVSGVARQGEANAAVGGAGGDNVAVRLHRHAACRIRGAAEVRDDFAARAETGVQSTVVSVARHGEITSHIAR